MESLFKKHETLFTIGLIVIYVVMNSYMIQNFGYTSLASAIANTVLSILIVILIIVIKRIKYYGLTKAEHKKELLFFIPLIIISLFNLRYGITIANKTHEIIFHIITMINVGFIEEILFRGFLFKMMEKDNLKTAIIVSSITFGLGHIVNLLNGADLVPTLLQVCYAIAIGYMLVMVFIKSKSLIPCIIFHGVFNSLSIISSNTSGYISTIILMLLTIGYGYYISRKVKN
ncbi:MAG: CPBP family intramembrane metalloprotease [Bacilli bacterium]|nr:CPBP family intramembrane metalloprotease [Bacilli bacterium]MBR6950092.1 CPBP family intramembrane metalloprotease [Bacilli bacterium]